MGIGEIAGRPAAGVGRAGDAVPHGEAAARPGLRAVRTAGDDPRPVGARGVRGGGRGGPGLCRLSRSASCCCPARMTARITPSCWPPARRRWGGAWCCSPPTPAATRCSPTGRGWRTRRATSACGRRAWRDWRNCARRRSELGVRLIACEAGLRAEGLDAARLLPGVRGRRRGDVPGGGWRGPDAGALGDAQELPNSHGAGTAFPVNLH